jgi:putative endonuclease
MLVIPSLSRAEADETPSCDGKSLRLHHGAMHDYYVYFVASQSRVLYIGVTNDLPRRIWEHQHKLLPGFTSKYNVSQLVYFEDFRNVRDAIAREKQLKGWRREKKIMLIESVNPTWQDLSRDWEEIPRQARDDRN